MGIGRDVNDPYFPEVPIGGRLYYTRGRHRTIIKIDILLYAIIAKAYQAKF